MHILSPLLLLPLLPSALAWGAVGHETVATIAQIHLHDSARTAIQQLLKDQGGHLATIASWADRVRMLPAFRFSGELHYTSPLEDFPPSSCHFGDAGWKTDHDILHAITNYTTRLAANADDGVALRFVTHFIGDAHQPLHLTNRDRGGNGFNVLFDKRHMNLHSLWDNQLLAKAVRERSNYTEPLPSRQIEDNLRGTIYDPYIRLLLWSGVRQWWRASLPGWFLCPSPITSQSPSTQLFFSSPSSSDNEDKTTKLASIVCPQTWAEETHKITCSNTFPPVSYNTTTPTDLLTKEYYGPIRDGNLVELLLAQGGLRLAATLNAIFADEEEVQLAATKQNGLAYLNLSWLEESEETM